MKKCLLVLAFTLTLSHAHADSQLTRSQAKVVGAIGGAYIGGFVGMLAGALIGAARGQESGAAIGAVIGLPVGAGAGALIGSAILGNSRPPDEDETAKLDFHRRVFATATH